MTLIKGQSVEVYYNLHKHCFSVRDKKTKRVVSHEQALLIKGKFKVSEAGRQRVIKEKRKNVHAYCIGEFISFDVNDVNPIHQAYYNPYTTKFFIDHCSKQELKGEYYIWLIDKDVFYEEVKPS